MRMGRRGDRYYSSEQALNKLLSIQCAFLEQRDETLNGVLHTLLLLGRGHAATITADAQRRRSAAGARATRAPGPLERLVGRVQCQPVRSLSAAVGWRVFATFPAGRFV